MKLMAACLKYCQFKYLQVKLKLHTCFLLSVSSCELQYTPTQMHSKHIATVSSALRIDLKELDQRYSLYRAAAVVL
jgi:hypothetical protein